MCYANTFILLFGLCIMSQLIDFSLFPLFFLNKAIYKFKIFLRTIDKIFFRIKCNPIKFRLSLLPPNSSMPQNTLYLASIFRLLLWGAKNELLYFLSSSKFESRCHQSYIPIRETLDPSQPLTTFKSH